MGRKKISLGLIEDEKLRKITYSKRMRGLIKKAMELSSLCNQDISLVIYDSNELKLVKYSSDNFEK